jgi:hypothetical protein
MVRPLKPLLVSSLLLLGAGVAFADKIVLHPGDSITLDGSQYSCGDPNATGAQIAIGDKVTVNGLDIKCRARKDGSGPPAPATTTTPVDATSTVDTNCINFMAQISGSAPHGADAARWADSCRGFELGKQCTVTASTPDDNCFNFLSQVVSGGFSGGDAARTRNSCKQIQGTCPAPANAVESKVDTQCMNQLASASAGGLDGHAVIGMAQQCRDHAVGQCVVVGGAPDTNCMNFAAQLTSTAFTPTDVAGVARACRTLELRCP